MSLITRMKKWWGRPTAITFQIAKLDVKDGDVIVLLTERYLTPDQVVDVQTAMSNVVPNLRTLVIDSGFKLVAVLHDKTFTLHKEKDAA